MKTIVPLLTILLPALLLTGCLQKRGEGTNPTVPAKKVLNGIIRVDDVTGEKSQAYVQAIFWEPEKKASESAIRSVDGTLLDARAEKGKCSSETRVSGRAGTEYLNMGKMGFGIEGAASLLEVPLGKGNFYQLVTDGGLDPSRYDISVEGNETFRGFHAQVAMPVELEGVQVNEASTNIEVSRSGNMRLSWEAPSMISGYYEMGVDIFMPQGDDEIWLGCSVLEQDLSPDGRAVLNWEIPASELAVFPENGVAQIHVHRAIVHTSGTQDKSIVLLLQGRRRWYQNIALVD